MNLIFSNHAQPGFAENLELANSLPDIDQLTKLANELFTTLPCDGSRLGLAATAVQGRPSLSLAGLDNVGITGITPQGLGLPGEAALRQLFAHQKPAFNSVPDQS